jgi:hypothetical protein
MHIHSFEQLVYFRRLTSGPSLSLHNFGIILVVGKPRTRYNLQDVDPIESAYRQKHRLRREDTMQSSIPSSIDDWDAVGHSKLTWTVSGR